MIDIWEWSKDHLASVPPNAWVYTGLGLFVVASTGVGVYLDKVLAKHRGEKMVKGLQDAKVKYIVGEIMVDGIEEAVFKDRLSRSQANDVYAKIGYGFGLVDLLPKKKTKDKLSRGETEHLKQQIKERIKTQEKAEEQKVVKFVRRKAE